MFILKTCLVRFKFDLLLYTLHLDSLYLWFLVNFESVGTYTEFRYSIDKWYTLYWNFDILTEKALYQWWNFSYQKFWYGMRSRKIFGVPYRSTKYRRMVIILCYVWCMILALFRPHISSLEISLFAYFWKPFKRSFQRVIRCGPIIALWFNGDEVCGIK